ncbi:hypothetical protein MiSe_14350 [Microseira wollei NIES-4236]|uniref:Uncharacterized protein n=1 Tax=Microseira wollei NIES-4236 TaxID=2530354 RepID=A0AAV3X381_9CYAN|nr:hypothetical protein MiSe_14350 [Microseira wollei NIES-4236]
MGFVFTLLPPGEYLFNQPQRHEEREVRNRSSSGVEVIPNPLIFFLFFFASFAPMPWRARFANAVYLV